MLLSLRQSNSTDTNITYEASLSPDESETEHSVSESAQVSPHNIVTPPHVFDFPDQPNMRRGEIIEMGEFNLKSYSEDSAWSVSSQIKRQRTSESSAGLTSLPCSYDGSQDGAASMEAMARYNASKLSRGRYKCSRCGALKTNHLCALVEDLVMVHSQGTQSEANIVDTVNGEPVFRERTLTVRSRPSIQS
eukprot:gene25394-31852_t